MKKGLSKKVHKKDLKKDFFKNSYFSEKYNTIGIRWLQKLNL